MFEIFVVSSERKKVLKKKSYLRSFMLDVRGRALKTLLDGTCPLSSDPLRGQININYFCLFFSHQTDQIKMRPIFLFIKKKFRNFSKPTSSSCFRFCFQL